MKIHLPPAPSRLLPTREKRNGQPASRRAEQGLAVITVMTVLAIVLICVAGNIRMLYSLERELKLVQQRQIRRLQAATSAANLSYTNNLPAQTNSLSR